MKLCTLEENEHGSQTIKSIKVISMETCVTYLDMLDIHKFILKNKISLKADFVNLIKWFLKEFVKFEL